jgi:serine/threonine protein kinase
MHRITGHTVAMKIYEKKNLKEEETSIALRREICILAALNHSNIVSLYEVINSRTHVHLVMELCDGKSLYHLIKKANE